MRVDQQQAPDDFRDGGVGWRVLGVVEIASDESTVRLTNDANGYVMADAIRIEPVTVGPSLLPATTVPVWEVSGASPADRFELSDVEELDEVFLVDEVIRPARTPAPATASRSVTGVAATASRDRLFGSAAGAADPLALDDPLDALCLEVALSRHRPRKRLVG